MDYASLGQKGTSETDFCLYHPLKNKGTKRIWRVV